mgnify:CR=1 FL=1
MKKINRISRRNMLPLLVSSLLLPFIGFSKTTTEKNTISNSEEEYQTLLKPDGTAVKVKISALKNATIIKKNVSNKSFLNWLNKKF